MPPGPNKDIDRNASSGNSNTAVRALVEYGPRAGADVPENPKRSRTAGLRQAEHTASTGRPKCPGSPALTLSGSSSTAHPQTTRANRCSPKSRRGASSGRVRQRTPAPIAGIANRPPPRVRGPSARSDGPRNTVAGKKRGRAQHPPARSWRTTSRAPNSASCRSAVRRSARPPALRYRFQRQSTRKSTGPPSRRKPLAAVSHRRMPAQGVNRGIDRGNECRQHRRHEAGCGAGRACRQQRFGECNRARASRPPTGNARRRGARR